MAGGIFIIQREFFARAGGFDERFTGWGGEDDDMSNRIKHHGFIITRYSAEIARYTMLKHKQAIPNKKRWVIIETLVQCFASLVNLVFE